MKANELSRKNEILASIVNQTKGFSMGPLDITIYVCHLSQPGATNYSFYSHKHSTLEFSIILEDVMHYTTPAGTVKLGPNDIFFMPPGLSHTWHAPNQALVFGFQSELMIQHPNSKKCLDYLWKTAEKFNFSLKQPAGIVSQFKALLTALEKQQPYFKEEIRNYVQELHYLLFKTVYADLPVLFPPLEPQALNASGRVKQIKNYILANIKHPLTLPHLSNFFNISSRQLVRIFQEAEGITIQTHIQNVKMERAAIMLVNTSLPIKAIAFENGFKDQNYFSTVFRKSYDISPMEYREKNSQLSKRDLSKKTIIQNVK